MARFLTLRSDYGILLLLSLANQSGGECLSIADIAKELNISPSFLEQIAYHLKTAGLISAQRGRGGGYKLAQDPQFISVSSVIEVLEGPIEAVACQSTGCVASPHCLTQHFWLFFQRHMHKTLREITIADLQSKKPYELLPTYGEKSYGKI